MKTELSRISPLRAGLVFGTLYGILSLLFVPFLLLMGIGVMMAPMPISEAGGAPQNAPSSGVAGVFFIVLGLLIPVLHAAFGAVAGILIAFLYNLAAKFTGGLEFEVRIKEPQKPLGHTPPNSPPNSTPYLPTETP